MDYLREGIHLRGFAQIEPIVAYKNEAFTLFQDLMNTIWSDFARHDLQRRGRDRGRERQRPAAQRPPAPASTVFEYSGGTPDDQPSAYGEGDEEDEPGRAPVQAAARRRERAARPQRPVLVRVGQEVQEVPRGG